MALQNILTLQKAYNAVLLALGLSLLVSSAHKSSCFGHLPAEVSV